MILIFLLVTNIFIEPEYYTNTNYYYDMAGKGSIIYGATNGGLVAYDYIDETFLVLTNTDGLQMNKQNSVGLDSSGYIWCGNDLGLALIDNDFDNIYIYPPACLTSTIIQVIYCLKDSIYVGSSGGLLFVNTKGTPDDFDDDERMRIWEIHGLPSNNILSIAVDDTLVWVGTDNGLASFAKDFTNPVIYRRSEGLLSNIINDIHVVDTTIYVATDSGLNRYQGDHFDTLLMGMNVLDISNIRDSLVLVFDSIPQIAFFHGSDTTLIVDSLPWKCRVLTSTVVNNEVFCGLANRYTRDYYGEGIGRYHSHDSIDYWGIVRRSCLPSNHITDITANEHGVFVGCGRRANDSRGFGWLTDNGEWINYSRDSILPVNRIHRCKTAPDGKVWFGVNSVLRGVVALSFDPTNDEWNFLEGRYNGMDSTNALWDLAFDLRGNLFLQVGAPSNRLWIIDSALNSVTPLEPIREGFYMDIAIDSTGNIWRTIVDAGLVRTNTNNTLFNTSDDEWNIYTTSDGLISNYTRGCVVDKKGNLYIATDVGLAIYDGENFSGNILNEDLYDLELDSEGRVWVLAQDGIFYYDPEFEVCDGFRFREMNVHIDFLTAVTEIIQVQGFEFDPIRKCFWIGGEMGLLKVGIQIDTLSELDDILIYPNPVVGYDIVRIKNIPRQARVSIYSIAGRLVEKDLLPHEVFGEVVWEIPEDIGSGLYFVLVKSDQGDKVCKFAIIR